MSTLPAEMVRLGSICGEESMESFCMEMLDVERTYHHSNEWILKLLIIQLCVDVNTGQPAPISWV